MLTQFTVKNFKSIRDEATLDMQAVGISEHTDRIIKVDETESYLPVSVIYGPNGGGKSNVLEAVNTLKSRVIIPIVAAGSSDEDISRLPVVPFSFEEPYSSQPTEFEIFFRTDNAEYRYILTILNDIVMSESLDRVKFETGRRSSLFSREKQEIQMTGDFGKLNVPDDLSATLPLLSYLGISYRNNAIVDEVISWFETRILFLNYGNPHSELRLAVSADSKVRGLMLQMIKEMDLDIEDYRVEKIPGQKMRIYTRHTVDGKSTELSLEDESSGTLKLFGILPYVASALLHGRTLVIDELDAKIHPLLLRYLINVFSDMSMNKKGAQLIFTSHDLTTMNSETFRRDEIWFVAKGSHQNSKLYSLVEFRNSDGTSVRKDARFDKQYLEGRYGADPYLKRIINWEEING